MKENSSELTEKIIRREKQLRRQRMKKAVYALSASAGLLLLFLCMNIGNVAENTGRISQDTVGYGAMLASAGAGSYVFTAVVAFVLGAVVTLLCLQLKKYLKAQEAKNNMEK